MKNKIYKLLSILLTITVLFTSVMIAMNVEADTDNSVNIKEYFVMSGATGGNGTETAPFGNIGQAVNYALNDGCTADYKVFVTIIDNPTVEGADDVPWGTVEEYGFHLTVKSKTVTANIKLPENVYFSGDVDFANVNVLAGGTWPARKVFFNGKNVKFGLDTTLSSDYVAFGKRNESLNVEEQTVRLEGALPTATTYIHLGNETGSTVTRNGDVTLKLNSANGVISPSATYGNTAFVKNVNLDLTNLSSVKLQDFGAAGGWTIKGAVQIVCKKGFTITNEELLTTYAPDKGVYKIVNDTGLEEILEFIPGEVGKYKVCVDSERFTLTVKDEDNNHYPIETVGEEKYIALPAGGGTFTVTAQKSAETKEYYVSADGSSDNLGTTESTFLTIGDAVQAANSYGMIKGDAVTVIVKGEAQINWGTVPGYSFEMLLKSETDDIKADVLIPDKTFLSGDTVFKNVKLTAKALGFNDHNVIFDKGTEYSVEYPEFGTANTPSIVKGQTVIYRGKIYAPFTKITNDLSGQKIYQDDVNIVVDNPDTELGFYLKSNYGQTVYDENANLNIDIKNAKGIKFIDVGGTIAHKGAIQIIYKKGFQISGKEFITAANPQKGVYWIANNSGDANLLEFTETVGKYKVNSEYKVIAVSADGTSEIIAQDGYLTLTTPGEYVVKIDRPAITKDYYVSAKGVSVTADSRPLNAGTKENPVKTVADATRLIAQDNLASFDIANIYISIDSEVEWGSGAVNYAPTAIIQSQNPGAVATVTASGGIVFTGNVHFKSIQLMQKNMHSGIGFGHYNVTLDSASSIVSNYINIGVVSSPGTVSQDQNIEIYGVINASEFKLATGYGNTTYQNKINVIVDNNKTDLNVRFGASANTTTNYDGQIYIDVKNANTISYGKVIDSATVNINGSIQMIVNKTVNVTQAVKNNFEEIQAKGGKWYITNYSDIPDLISFGENVGEFKIKDNKKVYIRQYEVEKMDEVEGGKVVLPSGEYVISDAEIPYLHNDLHKMLYFRNSGHLENLYVRIEVTPGETYRMEYSVWSSRYEDLRPVAMQNGDYRWQLAETTIISEEKVDNYYKVVCEVTVPQDYAYPTAFFGIEMYPFDEGYLFDVSVYNAKDETKTNIMPNNNFYSGLDYWAFGYRFWGAIFSGDKGGTGKLEYNDNGVLRVVSFSVQTIQELIDACNPDDGKWWKDSQIKEEKIYIGYAKTVKGTLKDTDGVAIAKHKILLASADETFSAITDKNGKFVFKNKVPMGYYELFVETPSGKTVETGYGTFINENDVVELELILNYNSGDYEIITDTVVDDEEIEQIVATGSLVGTVYTPYLETVPGLKVYLEGIGEVTTDKNGEFAFSNVPIGDYLLYTVLSDGEKYELKNVTINENEKLIIRVKYDPAVDSDAEKADGGWIIWIVVASVVAFIVAAGVIVLLFLKKNKI